MRTAKISPRVRAKGDARKERRKLTFSRDELREAEEELFSEPPAPPDSQVPDYNDSELGPTIRGRVGDVGGIDSAAEAVNQKVQLRNLQCQNQVLGKRFSNLETQLRELSRTVAELSSKLNYSHGAF